jgi:DNA-binding transcriptional ArsR family regulator
VLLLVNIIENEYRFSWDGLRQSSSEGVDERMTNDARPSGDGTYDFERAVEVLQAMASEHRLRILAMLDGKEMTPGAMVRALAVNRILVSRHLRYLRDARLIRVRREGGKLLYFLASDDVRNLVREVIDYGERRAQRHPAPAEQGPESAEETL